MNIAADAGLEGDIRAGWFKFPGLIARVCTGLPGLLYVLHGMRQLSLHPFSFRTKK